MQYSKSRDLKPSRPRRDLKPSRPRPRLTKMGLETKSRDSITGGSLDHCKKMIAEPSRLIPRTPTEKLARSFVCSSRRCRSCITSLHLSSCTSLSRTADRVHQRVVGWWIFTAWSYPVFVIWYPYLTRILFRLKSYYPYPKTIRKCIVLHKIYFCAVSILPC